MSDVKVIMKQLEEGVNNMFTSGKYEEYLRFMGTFHSYSFNNSMLIWLQKPDASLVAGYKTWQNKKRQVKKGEKGIKILAPLPQKFIKEVKNEKGEKEEKEIEYLSFRTVSVFDVSQTEGEDLPEITKVLDGEVENFEELFKKLESVSPVPVKIDEVSGSANGYYSHTTNSIVVKAGMSEQQTIKTTIHEIAHAILHNDNGEEKDADRNTKEVQAESVAYIVCNALGLDTSDYSFGYVAGWSRGQELKELSNSMEVIRKTSTEIMERIGA